MKLDRDYYPLELAAKKLGCSPSDLLRLGVTSGIPIYAMPERWLVHVFGVSVPDDTDQYGNPAPVEVVRQEVRQRKSMSPWKIVEPVQLYPDTLKRYEANPEATEFRFIAPPPVDNDEFDSLEYQLWDGSSGIASPGIAISTCTLVVMTDDMKSLKGTVLAATGLDKPLSTKERTTALKLIIGMAIGGYGYDPTASKNSATQEIADDLASIVGDLASLKGDLSLDSDTVRKWLKEAAGLLPSDWKKT